MAGRKQAVGIEESSAHSRQDAGISTGSPTTRRSSRSRPVRRFSNAPEPVPAGFPHLNFSFRPKEFLENADETQDSREYVSG